MTPGCSLVFLYLSCVYWVCHSLATTADSHLPRSAAHLVWFGSQCGVKKPLIRLEARIIFSCRFPILENRLSIYKLSCKDEVRHCLRYFKMFILQRATRRFCHPKLLNSVFLFRLVQEHLRETHEAAKARKISHKIGCFGWNLISLVQGCGVFHCQVLRGIIFLS